VKGQGKRRLSFFVTGAAVLLFTVGLGLGPIAIIEDSSSLWRIADLCFDLALLAIMVTRGPTLLTGERHSM
jgi:hypothetical protein